MVQSMLIKIGRFKFINFLFFLTLLEMVLGGSGRIIVFGELSFRYILFFLIGLTELFIYSKHKLPMSSSFKAVYLFILYLTLHFIISLFYNPSKNVIVEYLGYIPLLSAPFFAFCFKHGFVDTKTTKKTFLFACFVLSLLSLIIWFYVLVTGPSSYQLIEIDLLRKYTYGSLTLEGSMIRVFLKGTVFCAISFVMCFFDWMVGERGKYTKLVMFSCLLSVLLSFTLGFFISITFCLLYLAISLLNKLKFKRLLNIIIISVPVLIFLIVYFDIYTLMLERFSGNYSLGFKLIQTINLIQDTDMFFLFGNGIGHELTIDYGYYVKTAFKFENEWAELLNHTGIVGVCLFLYVLYSIIKDLKELSNKIGNMIPYGFLLGIIILAIENLSNPFLNNAIGLTYVALCCGMTMTNETLDSA